MANVTSFYSLEESFPILSTVCPLVGRKEVRKEDRESENLNDAKLAKMAKERKKEREREIFEIHKHPSFY